MRLPTSAASIGFVAITLPLPFVGVELGLIPSPIAWALGAASIAIASFGFEDSDVRAPDIPQMPKRLAPADSWRAEHWVVLTLNTRRNRLEAMTPVFAEPEQLMGYLSESSDNTSAQWWDAQTCQADEAINGCRGDIEAALGTFKVGLFGACVINGPRASGPLVYLCYRERVVLRENTRQQGGDSSGNPHGRGS